MAKAESEIHLGDLVDEPEQGTRIKNGPVSWVALAILKSESLDLMYRRYRG